MFACVFPLPHSCGLLAWLIGVKWFVAATQSVPRKWPKHVSQVFDASQCSDGTYTHTRRNSKSKLHLHQKANCVHVLFFHLHLPEHFTLASICMVSPAQHMGLSFWSRPQCIQSYHGTMHATQCHLAPPPPFSLLRPASDHPVNFTVTGCRGGSQWSDSWGCISEETGLHAKPHLLSDSVHSAGGSHHPPSAFIACLSLCSIPPASPRVRLSPHLLPLGIVWLRRCWIQLPPRLLSAADPLEIPPGIICGWCFPPSCVCVCVCVCVSGFDATNCLDIFYICISWFRMLVVCVSAVCVKLTSVRHLCSSACAALPYFSCLARGSLHAALYMTSLAALKTPGKWCHWGNSPTSCGVV